MEDSTEKIQYEKMMAFFEKNLSFLKGTVYAAYGIFGVLAILFTFFFFKDRNEMQAERTALQVAYNEKVKQSKEEMDELKIKSQEIINKTQSEAKEEISSIKKSANSEISSLKKSADKKIETFTTSANDFIHIETKRLVGNELKTEKVQKIIATQATGIIQTQVNGLVINEVQKQAKNLVKINSWMTQFTQGSFYANREHLENFNAFLVKEFPDINDQYTVRQISSEIERNYETECFVKANTIVESQKFNDYDKDISDLSTNKEKIEILSNKLYRPDNLHDICTRKHLIGILQGRKFEYRCFNPNR
jgi:F0F1-type ATP synthase membrane subunit b/b'